MILQKRYLYNQKMYARSIVVIFLLLYIYRIFSGRLITNLHGAPLKIAGLDYTYWAFLLTQIPQFIIKNYTAGLLIDVLIPVVALCLFFRYNIKYLAIMLMALFFFQCGTLAIFSGNHNKVMVSIFMAFLPLCVSKKHFEIILEFSRYFLVFVIVSAAYHKLHNGAVFSYSHFYNALMVQHIDLSLLRPHHISYAITQFLLQSKAYSFAAFTVLFGVQLSFIIAVFTKKADAILFVFLLLFVMFTYLIMRIVSIDLLILAPTLWYQYKPIDKN
jgi:hypothetical protein